MPARDDRRDDSRRENALAWLERYSTLFADPAAFEAAIAAPPPVDLFFPGGEGDRELLLERLRARGETVERFAWAPFHARVPSVKAPGEIPEVTLGLAYPQGVVSGLPPALLAPRAGDLVLDACAAPGGKTLALAAAAKGPSRIFAGEVSRGRTGLLVHSLARHGITSALVVRQDASSFPRVGAFDRILLDVPCTGEGTFRIPRMRFEPSGEQGLARAAGVQRRILERGLELLAPGGLLAYSTCTYAPEENESVLTRVLAERPEIDVVELPAGLPGSPGVDTWHGESFDARLAHARRLTPADTGSWGFFVALLRKDPAAAPPRPRRGDPRDERLVHDAALAEESARWLEDRFGVPDGTTEPFIVTAKGRDIWFCDALDGDREIDIGKLESVAPGMRAIRRGTRGWRATTSLLRRLGSAISRNVVDLDDDALETLLAERRSGDPLGLAGQIAIRWRDRVVSGAHASRSGVELELPSAWR